MSSTLEISLLCSLQSVSLDLSPHFFPIIFITFLIHSISIFSSIAVYKALYKSFGGFAADVVAAIDQVLVFTSYKNDTSCTNH